MADQPNWLDRAIGWIAPHRALQRESARVALGRVRDYQAAKAGRRTSGWTTAGTSANAEIAPALATLRARSREQIRNNPYARIAIRKLATKTVGTGIVARHTNKRAAALWKDWAPRADFDEHFDFYGLQNLIANGIFESGEVLIRRHLDRSGSGVPLRLQVLEPDYLDSSKHGPMPGGNYAIAGVEIDTSGRRVAYHLYRQHPGDNLIIKHAFESVRVPAADIIHLYEKDRPGQLRGIPRLSTSLMKLRDLDDYEDAELVRKKIEACFAAFVTTSDNNRVLANAQTETNSDGVTTRTETLAPGLIEYLRPGETITFGTPSSSSGYGEYTRTQLHAIAVGAGVTYQQLTGDLTSVNLSSIRAGMIDFNEMMDQFRWLNFIPIVCARVNAWFIEAAYLANLNRSQDATVLWTPPKRQWVDPIKEVEAARMERMAGMESLSEQIRQKGDDPAEKFAEIAAENAQLKALGIVIDTDPAHKLAVDTAKAEAAATTPDAGDGNGDDSATNSNTPGSNADT
jgi:lambda family phage portal protein